MYTAQLNFHTISEFDVQRVPIPYLTRFLELRDLSSHLSFDRSPVVTECCFLGKGTKMPRLGSDEIRLQRVIGVDEATLLYSGKSIECLNPIVKSQWLAILSTQPGNTKINIRMLIIIELVPKCYPELHSLCRHMPIPQHPVNSNISEVIE